MDIFKKILEHCGGSMPRGKKVTTKNAKQVGELEVGRLVIDALELFKNNCKTNLVSNDFSREGMETVSGVLDSEEVSTRDRVLDQVHLLFKE